MGKVKSPGNHRNRAAWGAGRRLTQTAWVPGTEITGQSVQVETNGVTNTVYFDPGGVARIQTRAAISCPAVGRGGWSALPHDRRAPGMLALCQPFQAGQQIT
jgi:hypothetical protein